MRVGAALPLCCSPSRVRDAKRRGAAPTAASAQAAYDPPTSTVESNREPTSQGVPRAPSAGGAAAFRFSVAPIASSPGGGSSATAPGEFEYPGALRDARIAQWGTRDRAPARRPRGLTCTMPRSVHRLQQRVHGGLRDLPAHGRPGPRQRARRPLHPRSRRVRRRGPSPRWGVPRVPRALRLHPRIAWSRTRGCTRVHRCEPRAPRPRVDPRALGVCLDGVGAAAPSPVAAAAPERPRPRAASAAAARRAPSPAATAARRRGPRRPGLRTGPRGARATPGPHARAPPHARPGAPPASRAKSRRAPH